MAKHFGQIWREKRTEKRLTLREVSERLGLSVSYLSDIEQGRKGAPDIDIVRHYESIVGVIDQSLSKLAQSLRRKLSAELIEPLKTRPLLADLLLRCEGLTDEELKKLVNDIGQKKND